MAPLASPAMDASTSDASTAAFAAELLENVSVPDAQLYLIGFGHAGPADLTLGALTAMHRSKAMFGLPPPSFAGHGGEVIDLRTEYDARRPRQFAYAAMAARVVDRAVQDPPVAFLTFGSAMVGCAPAFLMMADAARRGVRTAVLGGVSFLEPIWCASGIDPLDGCLIWDTTRFLASDATPPSTAHLVLAQPAVANIPVGPGEHGFDAVDLVPLRDRLLRDFEPGHEVTFIRCETLGFPPTQTRVRLDDLTDVVPHPLETLLVPARQPGPLLDWNESERSPSPAPTAPITRIASELLAPPKSSGRLPGLFSS